MQYETYFETLYLSYEAELVSVAACCIADTYICWGEFSIKLEYSYIRCSKSRVLMYWKYQNYVFVISNVYIQNGDGDLFIVCGFSRMIHSECS